MKQKVNVINTQFTQIDIRVIQSISTYRILPTFGPSLNQAWVEGVTLLLITLTALVHMCPSAQDLLLTIRDVGVYGDGVGF